jgi:hypothetical protein
MLESKQYTYTVKHVSKMSFTLRKTIMQKHITTTARFFAFLTSLDLLTGHC